MIDKVQLVSSEAHTNDKKVGAKPRLKLPLLSTGITVTYSAIIFFILEKYTNIFWPLIFNGNLPRMNLLHRFYDDKI